MPSQARQLYRERHPERDKQDRREAKARWIARNPEKHAAGNRQRAADYRRRFPEKTKACCRAWYVKNRERARESNLIREFGLTLDQWKAKFEAQGFRCGCCGSDSPQGRKGWQTDHCHASGKVRDILCVPCNRMLTEHLEANLDRAVAYLTRHRES